MGFPWGVLSFHWLSREYFCLQIFLEVFQGTDKVLDETRRLFLSQSYCVQHSPFDFGSHYKESTSSDVQVPQQFQTDELSSKPEAIVLVCGAL